MEEPHLTPSIHCRHTPLNRISEVNAKERTYTGEMQFLFVDSNLFLQCRPMRELDWDRFFGQDEVTILIPSAVLTELDKHKSDGNGRRAQRARAALTFLESLLDAPDDTVVLRSSPARVIAKFAPEVSSEASESNDDSILSEVTDLVRIKGDTAVSLITHDTNLKVKAKRKGLRYFAVPDDWLLAAEPDERDKRIKRLEDEVVLLKKQIPTIDIALHGGEVIQLVVSKYEPLSPIATDRILRKITEKFPMKMDFSLTLSQQEVLTSRVLAHRWHPPPAWEISKYQNQEYPEWEMKLRKRLETIHINFCIRDTKTPVSLLISNNGTVPAAHIQVAIKVSNGLLIAHQSQHEKLIKHLFISPRAPDPPSARQTGLEGLSTFSDIHNFSRPFIPDISVHRDRDEFYRKAGENVDTEWILACENMRHGGSPEEFSFIVGMSAQANPTGGQMSVQVSAENLPNTKSRDFRIKITTQPADTEQAVYEWLSLCKDA